MNKAPKKHTGKVLFIALKKKFHTAMDSIGKNRKIIAIVIIAMAAVYFTWSNGAPTKTYHYSVATRGSVVERSVVSGNIKPVNSVELGFEVGGKVKEVLVDVGDLVKKGQKLASLELGELIGDLRQAEAGVDLALAEMQQTSASLTAEKANLAKLKKGAKQEEINVAIAEFENAKKSLAEAKKNLVNVKQKATEDIAQKLSDAKNSLSGSVSAAKNALVDLSDIQSTYFRALDEDAVKIENSKEDAIFALFGVGNAGSWDSQFVSELESGLYGEIQQLGSDSNKQDIQSMLNRALIALESTKKALKSVTFKANVSNSDRTSIQMHITTLETEINSLATSNSALLTQTAQNNKVTADAEASVTEANNALLIKQKNLQLIRSGATKEELDAQEAVIAQITALLRAKRALYRQSEGKVQNIKSKIAKRIINSPIIGTVTRQNAEVGEIIAGNTELITVITETKLEIEANVPEVEIAKLSIGNPAEVTLDAYGDEKQFQATVVEIDPASTIIDSLPTYKVTLEFEDNTDLVKPGMTANIVIISASAEDVIVVPTEAIRTKDNQKYVSILPEGASESDTVILEQRQVVAGKSGSGLTEIKEGLYVGERVITSIE